MIDDHRHRILQAAARVYSQHGWRGATTRRIADEAGVNEVTLFRHFGSKDALLEQMMRAIADAKNGIRIAEVPDDPERELFAWARTHRAETASKRAIIRQIMSDAEERPDVIGCATDGPNAALQQLRRYVAQLHEHGFVDPQADLDHVESAAAITMFMTSVFTDGMNRDIMPSMFPAPVDDSLRAYVRIFLRGIGARQHPSARHERSSTLAPTLTSISE